MVRERRTTRTRRTRPPTKKPGSIWDTPHLQQILSEPAGTPINLTKAEARAILNEHLENPGVYDEKKAERAHRELRKIRQMLGSIARDV